jgi:bifunctional DNA-binding transcriptional regulator/antitoxin component of YhaV-PrlF toxin-antitoxin module
MSDDQKKVITAKVKDTYSMYRASQGEVIVEKKQTEKEKELKDISPQMLKEIEFYSKTIDSILLKIEETFTKYGQIVTPTKRSDLERFQQVLQQSKGSSNL